MDAMTHMATLVKISDGVYVNPHDVTDVTFTHYRDAVVVKLRDGSKHLVRPEHRELTSDLMSRVVALVNCQ